MTMYSKTDDIIIDYKALLNPFVGALNSYVDFLKALSDKERFKAFFTSEEDYSILKNLNKDVNDFSSRIEALSASISDSINVVENPLYAQYFIGSLDKWMDIISYVNNTFNNLKENREVADKELAENQMEGLLNMIDRDYDKCKSAFGNWYRNLDVYITDIQYIHRFDELDVTDYSID